MLTAVATMLAHPATDRCTAVKLRETAHPKPLSAARLPTGGVGTKEIDLQAGASVDQDGFRARPGMIIYENDAVHTVGEVQCVGAGGLRRCKRQPYFLSFRHPRPLNVNAGLAVNGAV